MDDARRRELIEATFVALQHTVGREEHLPVLRDLVTSQAGPVTFSELAEALASVDVSGRDPEWQEEWSELVDALRRAAEQALTSSRSRR
jgi:hypothetical protein